MGFGNKLSLAALVSYATAYSAHTTAANAEIMDTTQSTKILGLVLWEYFFEQYVIALAPDEPEAYVAEIHACWFIWTVENWSSTDERWAIVLTQNCHPSMVAHIEFDLSFSAQTGTLVSYDDASTAEFTTETVTKIFSTNTKRFGIILNKKDYDSKQSVLDDISYLYRIRLSAYFSPYTIAEQTNLDTTSCSFVHDRLKLPAISEVPYINTGVQFEDPYFKPEEVIYWENARGELGDLKAQGDSMSYVRAFDAGWSKRNGYSLWGSNGIEFDDMEQGDVGNCYLISGAATIAENPERIKKIFDNEDLNDEGFYQLNMYMLGSPITIQIDDRLPLDAGSKPHFAQLGKDKSLWGPLIEKAFAKFYGNYEVLEAGWAGSAMSVLTGGPFVRIDVKTQADLFNLIKGYNERNFMFNAGSNHGSGSNDDLTSNGIVNAHAYTLIGAVEINGTQLFKMRNPWAIEKYSGPWSDGSAEWGAVNAADKIAVGYTDNDDGIFFIPIATFIADFATIDMVPETEDMHVTRFLMLNDQRESNADYGELVYPNNTRHNFSLTSTVNQTVWVTVYVHHARSYPFSDSCNVNFPWELTRHALKIDGVSTIGRFADGQITLKFEIVANVERFIHTEFNWNQVGITKDFGVVVYGEQAALTLTHSEGLLGTDWPVSDQSAISGSSYSYPLVSTPPTGSDLTNWAAAYVSSDISETCELKKVEGLKPFEGIGDDSSAFLLYHRCPGKIYTTEVVLKNDQIGFLDQVDSNYSTWLANCTPHPQASSYSLCVTEVYYTMPFAVLHSQPVNFYVILSSATQRDEE